MPQRFESNAYTPMKTKLMKDALEAAWLKCKASRADEAKIRTLLASAIIEQVDAGILDREKIVAAAVATLAVARNIPH
jgi:hypothetical protein